MACDRRRLVGSERATLTPFVVTSDDLSAPRDQRDLMERPFFSLAKSKRTAPIIYKAGDTEVQVHGLPEHGMATIWDADLLIWAATQLVEAADAGRATSRFFRFTPYQLLTAIGRGPGQHQYVLLKRALQRLQSTVIATSIRNGQHWRRGQFSWVNEWEETACRVTGRALGMEFVLPEWFYQGVLDRSLVLRVDPAYFRLTGGIERWLYRVARKHAGRQPGGWTFDMAHLHAKSGSLARTSDFAIDVRRIAARQSLPGYLVWIERNRDGRELVRLAPRSSGFSTGPVEEPVNGVRTSGADLIRTSGAQISADQAHAGQLSLWSPRSCETRNLDSNSESNSSVVGAGKSRARRSRSGRSERP